MNDGHLIFKAAEMYLGQEMSIREISAELKISRESVYPLLAKARQRGFIRLMPPIENTMAAEVAGQFGLDSDKIRVANVDGHRNGQYVAAAAAEMVLDLIKQVGRSGRDPVRLGLGPGRATLDFSLHLAALLRTDPRVPKLKLLAISSGCPARSPEYSSVSFFNLFPRNIVSECLGLFAETVVTCSQFKKIKRHTGVAEAFAERDEVDIVVTAMGDVEDQHDLLRTFLKQSGTDIAKMRGVKKWVGNVQYRPYSASGPVIQKGSELRAVTLFELEDFRKMALSKGKHVVLIVRQCGICGKDRAKVLRPLLQVPELRVWSELVMDISTAGRLLSEAIR